MKQAGTLVQAFDKTDWKSLEMLRDLADEHAAQRDKILGALGQAVAEDEHVTSLAGALGQAERDAKQLIHGVLKASQAPSTPNGPTAGDISVVPPGGVAGVVATPPPPIPAAAPGEKAGTWTMSSFEELEDKLKELEQEASAFKAYDIEVTWRLRERR